MKTKSIGHLVDEIREELSDDILAAEIQWMGRKCKSIAHELAKHVKTLNWGVLWLDHPPTL